MEGHSSASGAGRSTCIERQRRTAAPPHAALALHIAAAHAQTVCSPLQPSHLTATPSVGWVLRAARTHSSLPRPHPARRAGAFRSGRATPPPCWPPFHRQWRQGTSACRCATDGRGGGLQARGRPFMQGRVPCVHSAGGQGGAIISPQTVLVSLQGRRAPATQSPLSGRAPRLPAWPPAAGLQHRPLSRGAARAHLRQRRLHCRWVHTCIWCELMPLQQVGGCMHQVQ